MSTRTCPLLALVLAFAPPGFAGEESFRVRPPGSWVRPLALPEDDPAGPRESTGLRYLVFDRQILAAVDGRQDYSRVAWKVETTAGLQDASEVEIRFDPSFERLVIHDARVLRAGRAVWRFSPGEVRVVEAEQDLEARLYNGERTATIFVKGLRVGDTVDYAYTLEGDNPVLGGRFDTVLGVEFSQPVERVHRRVVWQRSSPLRVNPRGPVPRPTVTTTAEGTVYEWESRHARAVRAEERTPSWFVSYGRVELSDFGGWAEVARRGRELFAVVDAPAPALDALLRGWKVSEAPEDERIDRAVRFVQDEVRYLGLELGPHSHQPHSPAQTLERRFGDCKDKAALLVALLRRLGLKAWPALASTVARQGLDERLPALFAFDHAIVALQAGASLQFVDPTASEQGGRVRGRRPPPFARALVLAEDTRGLVELPYAPPREPTVEVAETFALADWNAAARLDVVTTYRDEDADELRQSQSRSTRQEMGRRYREFYAQALGSGLRTLELPRVEDDREHNVVVVREAYEVPSLLQQGAHEFHAWFIDQRLARPRAVERSAPLALTHPEHVRQTVTVRLPGPPELAPLQETVESAGFAMDAAWSVRGNEARLQYTYRSLRGSLQPKEVPVFSDRLGRAADLVYCRVAARRLALGVRPALPSAPRPTAPAAAATRGEPSGSVLLPLAAFGCLAGLVVWGTRRGLSGWRAQRRRAAFQAGPEAGEHPQDALVVGALETVPVRGSGGICGCGGEWRETERASLLYDGRALVVVTRRCESCEREKALYFRLAEAG